jgi:hypothetical protein
MHKTQSDEHRTETAQSRDHPPDNSLNGKSQKILMEKEASVCAQLIHQSPFPGLHDGVGEEEQAADKCILAVCDFEALVNDDYRHKKSQAVEVIVNCIESQYENKMPA